MRHQEWAQRAKSQRWYVTDSMPFTPTRVESFLQAINCGYLLHNAVRLQMEESTMASNVELSIIPPSNQRTTKKKSANPDHPRVFVSRLGVVVVQHILNWLTVSLPAKGLYRLRARC